MWWPRHNNQYMENRSQSLLSIQWKFGKLKIFSPNPAVEIIQPYENVLLNLQEQNVLIFIDIMFSDSDTRELISMISGGVSLCILMAVTWRAWICMCVFASVLPSQRARSRVSSGREPLTFVWIRSVSAQRETSCSLLETTQTLILFPLAAHLILWPEHSREPCLHLGGRLIY